MLLKNWNSHHIILITYCYIFWGNFKKSRKWLIISLITIIPTKKRRILKYRYPINNFLRGGGSGILSERDFGSSNSAKVRWDLCGEIFSEHPNFKTIYNFSVVSMSDLVDFFSRYTLLNFLYYDIFQLLKFWKKL